MKNWENTIKQKTSNELRQKILADAEAHLSNEPSKSSLWDLLKILTPVGALGILSIWLGTTFVAKHDEDVLQSLAELDDDMLDNLEQLEDLDVIEILDILEGSEELDG